MDIEMTSSEIIDSTNINLEKDKCGDEKEILRKYKFSFSLKELIMAVFIYLMIFALIAICFFAIVVTFTNYKSVDPQDEFQDLKEPYVNRPYIVKFILKSGEKIVQGCAGFLIENLKTFYILTAHHCLLLKKNVTLHEIHIGGTREHNFKDMAIIPADHLIFNAIHEEPNGDFGYIQLKFPIPSSVAVHPIKLAKKNSILPKKLKIIKWTNEDVNRMDSAEFTIQVINQTECLKAYKAINATIDFYGMNNNNGIPIIICTDGGFIEAGNSGTLASDEHGNVFALLSRGPIKGIDVPNIFVDVRAYLDQLRG